MDIITKNPLMVQTLIENYLKEDDIAVDATCGNGNDTLYLANKCKKVYGFDIQDSAIKNTEKLLEEHNLNHKVTLIKDSHHLMEKYIQEKVGLIIFNLGYLPKGEKSITTTTETSIPAIKNSLNIIKTGGLVIITIYQGHEAGKKEKEELLNLASSLDKSCYHAMYFNLINQHSNPPEILAIVKKK